jgi:hypothetical protein
MAYLKDIAQIVMDLYYQNYKADEEFFKKHHFKYLVTVCYNSFIQDYYDLNYTKNLAENGHAQVDLSSDWFVEEEAEVKYENGNYTAILKNRPFAFLHDNQYRSISDIVPVDCDCDVRLSRIKAVERWKLSALPATSYTFWYLFAGNRIRFEKVKCGIGKIIVYVLPSLVTTDDKAVIASGLQQKVIEATLNLMFQARQGTVVDFTNNQNPNKVMETEIDTVFRGLKTKP